MSHRIYFGSVDPDLIKVCTMHHSSTQKTVVFKKKKQKKTLIIVFTLNVQTDRPEQTVNVASDQVLHCLKLILQFFKKAFKWTYSKFRTIMVKYKIPEYLRQMLGRPRWLNWMGVRLMIRRLQVRPPPSRQHSFVEIDREIFSTVILSLQLIQEGELSASGERMCTILVNR